MMAQTTVLRMPILSLQYGSCRQMLFASRQRFPALSGLASKINFFLCLSSGAESTPDYFYLRQTPVRSQMYCHDVETAATFRRRMALQIMGGYPEQMLPFPGANCLSRMAKGARTASLDFNKNKVSAFPSDNIDFPVLTAIIPLDYGVAGFIQSRSGHPFSHSPQFLPRPGHGCSLPASDGY
jgi:hypothetical protein